jgi:hypothetical protein
MFCPLESGTGPLFGYHPAGLGLYLGRSIGSFASERSVYWACIAMLGLSLGSLRTAWDANWGAANTFVLAVHVSGVRWRIGKKVRVATMALIVVVLSICTLSLNCSITIPLLSCLISLMPSVVIIA